MKTRDVFSAPMVLPEGYVDAPSYQELVSALEQIRHATAPTPSDGGHHEAAHDLASAALERVEKRRQWEQWFDKAAIEARAR